jgi:hypothetical protein
VVPLRTSRLTLSPALKGGAYRRLRSSFQSKRDVKTKTEYQLKKQARLKAARELERTKKRLGLREPQPPSGVVPDPLVATTLPRRSKPAPTSDRIPGSPSASDLLHAYKWKRGVKETEATTREMRRKATQIAPAYNKGALQYLPENAQKDEWPERGQAALTESVNPKGKRRR